MEICLAAGTSINDDYDAVFGAVPALATTKETAGTLNTVPSMSWNPACPGHAGFWQTTVM